MVWELSSSRDMARAHRFWSVLSASLQALMCSWLSALCQVQTQTVPILYNFGQGREGGGGRGVAASLPWSRQKAVGTLARCGKWLSDKWAGMSPGLLLLLPLSLCGSLSSLFPHPHCQIHTLGYDELGKQVLLKKIPQSAFWIYASDYILDKCLE